MTSSTATASAASHGPVAADSVARRAEPLSFSRWLARRACAYDPMLLLLELLVANAIYRSRQLVSRVCLPLGGGPHAAKALLLEPMAHRADALLAAFPCGASHAGRLLYALRTGAATDPRMELRLTDWGGAACSVGQLLMLAVALAASRLYERTSHGPLVAATAAALLGFIAVFLRTPDTLLLATSAPPLHVGHAAWLLLLAGIAAMGRRTLPPGVAAPHRLGFAEPAALLLVAIAVLSYVVARPWERPSLRPQCRAYLCNGGGGAKATCWSAVGGTDHPVAKTPPPSSLPRQPRQQPRWPCATDALAPEGRHRATNGAGGRGARRARRLGSPFAQRQAAAGGGSGTPAAVAPGFAAVLPTATPCSYMGSVARLPAPRSPRGSAPYRPSALIGNGRAVSRGTVVLSVKVPLLRLKDPTARDHQYEAAAAVVLRAADSALLPFLEQAAGGPRVGSGAGAGAATGVQADAAGGDGARRTWQLVRPASGMCVEGCVHLLLMARWVKEDADGGGGADGGLEAGSGTVVQHATLQQAGAEEASGVDLAALNVALKRLLVEAVPHDQPHRTQQQPNGAFIWPPAVALAAAMEAADGGAGGVSGAGGSAGAEVLVLLPAALLHGKGAVRCVVGGPSAQQQRLQVYMDVTAQVLGEHPPGKLPPGGGGAYLQLRLKLSPAALRKVGTVLLHLLPPPAGAEGPPAESPHALMEEPFASLPLLVLPYSAADEVRQLCGDSLGGGLQDTLDGLLGAVSAEEGACCGVLASGSSESAAAAADASAAIAASGLTDMMYDMGDLLQLPYCGAGVAAPPQDPTAILDRHLLGFLASRGMAACLRTGLQALRCAGVQLAEEEEAAFLAEAEAGGGQPAAEAAEGGEVWPGHPPLPAVTNGAAATASGRAGREEAKCASAVCGSPASPHDANTPVRGQAAPEAATGLGGRPEQQQPSLTPNQPAGPLWWLRVLLLGFSPPALERSYQAFKAVQCRALDCAALALLVVVRLTASTRTLRAVRAEGAAPRAPDALGAGRLTALQQQLLSELLYAGAALIPAALAMCTSLLPRRRNALLLLRVVLDAVALCCILAPPSWLGRPVPLLLRVSEAWTDSCRRHGKHWSLCMMFIPATLQLSPRQQSWAVLVKLLPFALVGFHMHYNRWGPALAFAAANALCSLLIAAATDLPTRRRFMRSQRGGFVRGGDGGRPLQCGWQGGGAAAMATPGI